MFVPLLDKLNKIVPELHQQEEFDCCPQGNEEVWENISIWGYLSQAP